MKQNFRFIVLVIGLGLSACGDGDASTNELPLTQNCDALSEQEDYTTLTGTLVINSKGEFVFKSISDDSLGISAPTYLVPCSASVQEYIEGQSIGYSSIRKLNDEFWITVSGHYLNLEQYKNQTTDFNRLEFLYNSVALEDNPQEMQALTLLDSINAIDQTDLIKINTRGCVNNCLPAESLIKLMNFTQELNELEYDVVWQTDSSKYRLVQFVR